MFKLPEDDEDVFGPEPTPEEVESALSAGTDDGPHPVFHETLIYWHMADEVSHEDPVYRLSPKRLSLATGLPMDDIMAILGHLLIAGLIEPVAGGFRVQLKKPEGLSWCEE